MSLEKIKEFLNKDMGKGTFSKTTNDGDTPSPKKPVKTRKEYQKNKANKMAGSATNKKKLSLSVTEDEVKGIVTTYKSGKLDIDNVFTVLETANGAAKEYLSGMTLTVVKENMELNKLAKKQISIIFENIETVSKIVKYPQIEAKLVKELIEDSYQKFFQEHAKVPSIRGVEYLGDMGVQKSEDYYFLSSVLKKGVLDATLRLEKNKVRVGLVYNDILALKNVMNSVNTEDLTKCMVYMQGDKTHVLVTHKGTLIFHKKIEAQSSVDSESLILQSVEAMVKDRVMGIIPDVNSTIDYVRQKENVPFTYLILAGELVTMPGVEMIMTEETGIDSINLDLKSHTNAFDLVNWSTVSFTDIESKYLVPYGLSLRGVVG